MKSENNVSTKFQCGICICCIVSLQVFDYDFGLQDDFMGSAYIYLESLEHQRSLDTS